MTYTPRPGDLIRDNEGELWFVYADINDYTALYAINAYYLTRVGGQPIEVATAKWGPLTLEYRPGKPPEETAR